MRKPFVVSDHCLLRYLERVKGIDMDAMRAEIASYTRDAAMAGAKRVRHAVGSFVIAHSADRVCVTTVYLDAKGRRE